MPRPVSLALAAILAATAARGDDKVYHNSSAYMEGKYGDAPSQSFASSPIHPPALNWIEGYQSPKLDSDEYTLLSVFAPTSDPPVGGPKLFDDSGYVVWDGGLEYPTIFELNKQEYDGQDVLTFWTGTAFPDGHGQGAWMVLDKNYELVTTIEMGNQSANTTDFHDMNIINGTTALVDSWIATEADLSGIGGPSDGWTWDCVFQEIDIASKKTLFEWRSLDHIAVNESYLTWSAALGGESKDSPFDHCHMNSLTKDSHGNYLISLRWMATLYYINGTSGEVIWRLSGKYSDFIMELDADFWFQHDARLLGDAMSKTFNISLFDNAAGSEVIEDTARGLILEVDTDKMTVTKAMEFLPSFAHTTFSQGGVDVRDDGTVAIGWGATPYASVYEANGTIISNFAFAVDNVATSSYRAHRAKWVGMPTYAPNMTVLSADTNDTAIAYVSWNGATEVASWHMLAMPSAKSSKMTKIAAAKRDGFETAIQLPEYHKYIAMAAYDSDDKCLKVSDVYNVEKCESTGVRASCPSSQKRKRLAV